LAFAYVGEERINIGPTKHITDKLRRLKKKRGGGGREFICYLKKNSAWFFRVESFALSLLKQAVKL
jgi:hypothetical protein